ncbi:hypothetical protein EYF80_011979 [Liparis tanakae]|uniref:Uncharacterized protein n=1 Tax=Liparis tanakae TaxID=230148 RepID=A0A4Z2IIV0_9TELE|nr:hypothetical protein EYF80_011979 [Liparis tanakae]
MMDDLKATPCEKEGFKPRLLVGPHLLMNFRGEWRNVSVLIKQERRTAAYRSATRGRGCPRIAPPPGSGAVSVSLRHQGAGLSPYRSATRGRGCPRSTPPPGGGALTAQPTVSSKKTCSKDEGGTGLKNFEGLRESSWLGAGQRSLNFTKKCGSL